MVTVFTPVFQRGRAGFLDALALRSLATPQNAMADYFGDAIVARVALGVARMNRAGLDVHLLLYLTYVQHATCTF
jgi:hypothetical protein